MDVKMRLITKTYLTMLRDVVSNLLNVPSSHDVESRYWRRILAIMRLCVFIRV